MSKKQTARPIHIDNDTPLHMVNIFGRGFITTVAILQAEREKLRGEMFNSLASAQPAVDYVASQFYARKFDESGLHPDECVGTTVEEMVKFLKSPKKETNT